MTQLEEILMDRDGMSYEEVCDLIKDAREDLPNYHDPSEFMLDWFGLEGDYFLDLF